MSHATAFYSAFYSVVTRLAAANVLPEQLVQHSLATKLTLYTSTRFLFCV
jgi:hypothetical protein